MLAKCVLLFCFLFRLRADVECLQGLLLAGEDIARGVYDGITGALVERAQLSSDD